MSRSDAPLRLEDFPHRVSDNVRFADLDPNGHVNHAIYATYCETVRVSLLEDPARGLRPPGFGWIVARLDLHFRSELRWPGKIDLGVGVAKIGRTSVTFEHAVFSEGRCVASAHSTDVLIDRATGRPTSLTDGIRTNLRQWVRKDAAL